MMAYVTGFLKVHDCMSFRDILLIKEPHPKFEFSE